MWSEALDQDLGRRSSQNRGDYSCHFEYITGL
jgi:hypothetical protein